MPTVRSRSNSASGAALPSVNLNVKVGARDRSRRMSVGNADDIQKTFLDPTVPKEAEMVSHVRVNLPAGKMYVPESMLEKARCSLKPVSSRKIKPKSIEYDPPSSMTLNNGMHANILQLDQIWSASTVEELVRSVQNGPVRFFSFEHTLTLDGVIASGMFGSVFKCTLSPPGIQYIIKISKESVDDPQSMKEMSHEYNMMTLLDCGPTDPIICAEGVLILTLPTKTPAKSWTKHMAIVMEEMDGTVLQAAHRMTVGQRFQMADKMLAVLDSLHRLGVYHMDPHGGNFLCKFKGRASVADYDIRMGDMGMSCYPKKGPSGATCADLHDGQTSDDIFYRDTYPDLVEFAQMSCAIWRVLGNGAAIASVPFPQMAKELYGEQVRAMQLWQVYMSGKLDETSLYSYDPMLPYNALIDLTRVLINNILMLSGLK